MICRPKHARPVHFNRGRHGNVWICLACGKQISGKKLSEDEVWALSEFGKMLADKAGNKKPS